MIDISEIIIRLLLGTLLGAIIGFERETHGRPAGFRTHLLVCLASVLIMIVSTEYQHVLAINPSYLRVDPARIAAGAITGVGFLGAGVIIKSGFTVQGLTTAACLWMVSAIGLSVGAGLYTPAIASTIISVLALWSLRRMERKMSTLRFRNLTITVDRADREDAIMKTLDDMKTNVVSIDYEYDAKEAETRFDIALSMRGAFNIRKFFEQISRIEGVSKVILKKR